MGPHKRGLSAGQEVTRTWDRTDNAVVEDVLRRQKLSGERAHPNERAAEIQVGIGERGDAGPGQMRELPSVIFSTLSTLVVRDFLYISWQYYRLSFILKESLNYRLPVGI